MNPDRRLSTGIGQRVGGYCLSSVLYASVIALSSSAWGATIRVPAQFPTIQAAINAAVDGDVISIQMGTYYPTTTIDPLGKAITLQGQVNPDGTPAVTIDGQNAITVLQCTSGEGPETRFENLVIMNGYTTQQGGGMLNTSGSSPVLVNCAFINNVADCDGGAIANISHFDQPPCSPSILGCTFERNLTSCNGGGIYNGSGFSVIVSCTFTNNIASTGGAIYDFDSSSTVVHSTINCNSAMLNGGGIALDSLSVAAILGCTMRGNSAGGMGGGIHFSSSSQHMENSLLCNNTPDQVFGAFSNGGGNNIGLGPDCCPDLNGDALVDGADLAILLTSWGACTSSTCPGDLNGDGVVSGTDLALVLASWGLCPSCS